jgi:plastocyanin
MPLLRIASAGRLLRPALAILSTVLIIAACQATGPGTPIATSQVDLPRSYRFVPEDIAIPVGTTVTWTNHDEFTHTVRMLDSAEVQMMRPGESVTRTFTAPGLYRYDCSLHPNDMQGSVLVEEGPA